jgi:SAM-dependent methyltransferase
MSLRSLGVVASQARSADATDRVLPVLADITSLPFLDGTFPSVSTAETLEHVRDHQAAVGELARVLEVGGTLAGTVPAGPEQWSEWDDWAGHLRRYTRDEMEGLLRGAGLEPTVATWGWPMVRLYDDLFLTRINRRRLQHQGTVDQDATLSAVSSIGRKRLLVDLVKTVFGIDKVFDGAPWGVGLLFSGLKTTVTG